MAQSDMVIFNEFFMPAIIEKIAQRTAIFNAASGGTITLNGGMFIGDTVETSFYKIVEATRRIDRYNPGGAPTPVDLTQDKEVKVKVAGGFGPVAWNPSQLSWLRKPTGEAIQVVSEAAVDALMADQLNTIVASAVAGIGNIAGATNDVSGGATLTQNALNDTHALFGDASQNITSQVMSGAAYHDLVGVALDNDAQLFTAGNVRVIDILGKATVISDIPALTVAGSPGTHAVLGLTQGALTVEGANDVIFNIDTRNGADVIETTWQSDYSFVAGIKGLAWDVSTGGVSPTDAELTTGTNWPQVVTSVKNIAGVLTIADRG